MSWRAPTLMLLLVASLYAVVCPWIVDTFGTQAFAAGLVGASLLLGLLVAAWQSRSRQHVCPHCQHVFSVSTWGNLTGQNWFGRLRTRCPSCGETDWCDPVDAA